MALDTDRLAGRLYRNSEMLAIRRNLISRQNIRTEIRQLCRCRCPSAILVRQLRGCSTFSAFKLTKSDNDSSVKYRQKPGLLSEDFWAATNSHPRSILNGIYTPYMRVKFGTVGGTDYQEELKVFGMSEDYLSTLQKAVLSMDPTRFDPRMEKALKELHINRLTALQRHLCASFQMLVPHEKGANYFHLHSVPSVSEAIVASFLPVLDHLCRNYPYRAMHLLNECNCEMQFPVVVFVSPNVGSARLAKEFAFRALFMTNVSVLPTKSLDSNHTKRLQRFGGHVLVGPLGDVLDLVDSGNISLDACEHMIIDDADCDSLPLPQRDRLEALQAQRNEKRAELSCLSTIFIYGKRNEPSKINLEKPQSNDDGVSVVFDCAAPGAQENLQRTALVPHGRWNTLFTSDVQRFYECVSDISVADALYVDQSEHSNEPPAETEVSRLDLDVRLKTALQRMGVSRLSKLQGQCLALYNVGQPSSHMMIHAVPTLHNSCLHYLLPVLQRFLPTLPQEGKRLAVDSQSKIIDESRKVIQHVPKLLIVTPSTVRAKSCLRELKLLHYHSATVSALAMLLDKHRHPCHIVLGTPRQIADSIEDGFLSLAACQQVVLDQMDGLKQEAWSLMDTLLRHPQGGLLASSSSSSAELPFSLLLASRQSQEDMDDRMKTFLDRLGLSKGTSQSQQLVHRIHLIHRLPLDGVHYTVDVCSSFKELELKLTEFLNFHNDGEKRILILWEGNPKHGLWGRLHINNKVIELTNWQHHMTQALADLALFDSGVARVLLLDTNVLRNGSLYLPRVDVVLTVNLRYSAMPDVAQCHRLLRAKNSHSITLFMDEPQVAPMRKRLYDMFVASGINEMK